jgi:pimeloyl-ACP methyl ester carboxylesterase
MTDRDYLSMVNSTIVRSNRGPWFMPLLRVGHRALSALAPASAGARAERLFLSPPRPRRPAAEAALLASACARPRCVGARQVEVFSWGTGPRVLLVHGWGGRGTQLGSFVAPLLARGFSVVTFDAPGHGASDSGAVTIPEMVTALREVAGAHGPISGLIAHSMGAAVATRALYEGVDVGAAVFVGAASDLTDAASRFTAALGFSRAVEQDLRRRIEDRVGAPWSAFEASALAPALATPLLIIHDRADAEVPWQHGMAVARAWKGAESMLTDGLGHRRILRDPDVIAAATAFLAARAAERALPSRLNTDPLLAPAP